MKINNSNDLNTYYSNTVSKERDLGKSSKTRLIVVKDETGEHLETKKLNIFERIGALFGGKASLGRIVEFCTKNQIHSGGLFESVRKYNSEHREKPISYSYMLVGEKKEGKSLTTEADLLMRMANLTSAVEYAFSKDKTVPLRELLTPAFVKQPEAQSKLEQYLQDALHEGKESVAHAIIDHLDADHLKRLVDNACGSGDVKLVSASLERRIDELEMNNTKGSYSPLMYAASGGKTDVVKCLLSYNSIDPTLGNYLGNPLRLAVDNGHPDVVKLLLSDARIELPLQTLINLLDRSTNPDITTALASSKFAKAVDDGGKTAFMLALEQGKLGCVLALIPHTLLDAKDTDGNTPLLRACQVRTLPLEERKAIVKQLLDKGGEEIFAKNNAGLDALVYGNDILDVFEDFAKGSGPLAAKMRGQLDTLAATKALKEIADTTLTQIGKLKPGDVSNDLKAWPKLEGEQAQALQATCTRLLESPDKETILKPFSKPEKKAILLQLARAYSTIPPESTLKLAPLLINTLEARDVLYSLSWLRAKMSQLDGILPPPKGHEKAAIDLEKELLISHAKNIMRACSDRVKAKEYESLKKGYPAFVP